MRLSLFTSTFLKMFSGPLIWAVHFLTIYAFAALACARRFAHIEWLGTGVVAWAISLFSLLAIAAISLLAWRFSRSKKQDEAGFAYRTAIVLSGLSVVAIIWETVPVFLVPACEFS